MSELQSSRFTLLVEDTFVLNEGLGMYVKGMVRGNVITGEDVYAILPDGRIIPSKVDRIETLEHQIIENATEQKVEILLKNIYQFEDMPKFSVLTNIKPQTVIDVNQPVENPQLLGLSMEYQEYKQDNAYLNILIYAICHAHFVVPMFVDGQVRENGNGTVTVEKNTKFAFPALQHPDVPDRKMFPVFTDWMALSKWTTVFPKEKKQPPKNLIMRFLDVVKTCKGDTIVVNPFGPMLIILSPELIQKIMNMEGFKREFLQKQSGNVQKVEVKKDSKFMIGIPKDTEEVKHIKEGLVFCAKGHNDVERIDLLLKMDEEKKQSYLCIVKCPKEKAAIIFENIHKAIAPYLHNVKSMDYMIYGQTKLSTDVVSDKSIVYILCQNLL